MNYTIDLPIKKGDKIFTIDNCKIEEYYVEGFVWSGVPNIHVDISEKIIVKLNRYNNGKDFSNSEKRLSQCFLTKEELINQL